MYAPHVLPAASDYDALCRAFRWRVPAHYNIGVDVCDRWAETRARPHRHRPCGRRRRGGRDQLRRVAGEFEPACQRAGRPWHRPRRPGRDPAAAGAGGGREPYRHLQARRDRAAARDAVRHRGARLSAAEFRRPGADHQCPGAGRSLQVPAPLLPDLELVLSIDGPAEGAADFHAVLARAAGDFTPADTTPTIRR